MTSKIINLGVLFFLLIPATQSVQKKLIDINNTSSTKYPVYSSHTRVYHELPSDKIGSAISTRSKEKSDEENYNKRVFGRDPLEENRTLRRSDNLWISEDKTKGMAKEEKIKDKNIFSARLLLSNKIPEGAVPSHRKIKDLQVTFVKGGRSKRFVHSRFTKVGDTNSKYPSYMSPGTKYQNAIEVLSGTSRKRDGVKRIVNEICGWMGPGTKLTEIEQDDSNHVQNNNIPPEFFNNTLERLLREMLLKQKVLDVRTRMEQYNTVWDMKFKLAILFLIMGFMIALLVGPKIIKFRFRRIDPDLEKTRGNLEAERCKASMKNKKRIAYFDTFLEKLRAHYRRKSESNSRLGDRASQKSLNVELNKIESERKPLLTDVRHIQPSPKSHSSSLLTKIYSRSAETPLSRGRSSSDTYFTAKEVPSVDQSGVSPSGSRGKLISSSHISVVASENVSSSASSRSREKVISTTKSSASPSTDLSTSSLRESGSSLFSVVPIMKQLNFIPSESKYPVPSEIKYQTPSGIKSPSLSENQATPPSGSNGLVVSSINKTDDPLKSQVMTDPNFEMAHESGSEETLYEQPTKFTLGKFYGSGGKRVYFHIKSQKKKKREDTK